MIGLRRALALTTASRYCHLIANFLMLSVVSRLLTPAEIGISVLGTAVATLVMALREFATPTFVIQRTVLAPEDIHTAITAQILISALIGIGLAQGGSSIASAYSEPLLIPYFHVIGLCIIIEGVSSPIASLLRRQMAFDKVALIGVVNAIVSCGIALLLAWLGYSYMSFAWGWLVASLISAVVSLAIWQDLSIFRPSLRSWRAVLRFGAYNGAIATLGRLYDYVPYLVLGRILPLNAVAVYNRSLTVSQIPDKVFFGGLPSLLMPAFSAHARDGGDLRQIYVRSIEHITGLQWPALAVLCILAHPIVRIIFGDQWLEAVPLVQIIALASLFSFSSNLTDPLLTSAGAIHHNFINNLIILPISLAILIIAAFWGLKAVAWAWFITLPFQAVVSMYFIQRRINITYREVMPALIRAFIVTLFSAAGPLFVVAATGNNFDFSIGQAIAAVSLSAAGWGLGLWITKHPLVGEIRNVIASLRHWRAAAPSYGTELKAQRLTGHTEMAS